ncbi:LysR family transcriptional regulator ArgP [Xenophilus arseniciresistens]|uniref:LysR family transcriptional regulator ArgP n=1 Tax=Xenophilus arseniciresistens TaxID=1283306 RepID=A0AAE3SZ75_9BURK|nr:LysR family transcriptional regulator ArgP [Xenophilus arseniciresistens]MDA7415566.1 LysR family transcriptional regulator ArgP [Xenophilus arseniciresistens]
MLDYAALSALAAVVREGRFERAARALHVTPSAVSQRVRLLEERAGCALVVRGQPCRPTEAGQQLCRHVDQVQLLEHELRGALPALRDARAQTPAPRRVTLPLAVNADSLATWFAPAAARFAAEAPVLLEVAVDDQDHTAQRLRSGAVLAAVTAMATPATGCDSRPLGAMRYVAAASPAFMARHFADGVNARSLLQAPCLIFDRKDQLQARWVRRQCRRELALPRHALPSPQAFVEASRIGMGWGMHVQQMVQPLLDSGELVELVPGTTLDVRLHWQQARAACSLLQGLTQQVMAAAREALIR